MRNDAAFPTKGLTREEISGHYIDAQNGLTKREYFAAMALQGMTQWDDKTLSLDVSHMARRAVQYADALIKELEK